MWSVDRQVVAAAALWLVRRGFGRSMVALVSVGFVALLPDVVCVAHLFVPALVSCVLIRPIAV